MKLRSSSTTEERADWPLWRLSMELFSILLGWMVWLYFVFWFAGEWQVGMMNAILRWAFGLPPTLV